LPESALKGHDVRIVHRRARSPDARLDVMDRTATGLGIAAGGGFGSGDAQPCAVGEAGLANDDVDVAPEGGERAEEALRRMLADVAAHKP